MTLEKEMNVQHMNLDQVIESGFLVRVKTTREPDKMSVLLTNPDGSEHLYIFLSEKEYQESHHGDNASTM